MDMLKAIHSMKQGHNAAVQCPWPYQGFLWFPGYFIVPQNYLTKIKSNNLKLVGRKMSTNQKLSR